MTWENPAYLWLLLLAAAMLIGSAFYRRYLRKRRQKYFSDDVFSKLYANEITTNRKISSFLTYLALVLIIIALAGPQIGTEVRQVERRGVDIMVMLDVSRSMLAQDVRPNRLDKARFEILRMIDRLQGDRIGLVAFSGEAVQLAPLTSDYTAFRTFLNIADPSLMPSGSTNFQEALRTALNAFESASGENEQTVRVLLLISDGEDHSEDIRSVTDRLTQQGILLHSVGIGTAGGATIPIYDPDTGRLLDYVRDAGQQIVTSRLEPGLLQEIAQSGRGQYYEITRSADGMDGFISRLSDMDAQSLSAEEYADYKNQYRWFVALALIALLVALALPRYRPPVND